MSGIARPLAVAVLIALATVGPARAALTDRFALDDAYREQPSAQRVRISLNGLWRFQPARDLSSIPRADAWDTLRVPGRWNTADVAYGGFEVHDAAGRMVTDWHGTALSEIEAGWYERDIVLAPECSGRRITLAFDHIGSGIAEHVTDYETTGDPSETLRENTVVLVNGQSARIDDDRVVDITGLLTAKTNVLTVGVKSRDRTRWGKGLNGDVWLQCEPITHIDDFDWSTSYADHALALTVRVRNGTPAPQGLRVRAMLNGTPISESPATMLAGGAASEFHLAAAVPKLPAWSEFSPTLTPLRLELLDGTTILDSITAEIAMREWRIAGAAITLNGRNIALRTESGPEIGVGMEAFDRDFVRAYLAAYRDAHYNGIRTLWGWMPDYVYDLTDRLGLMVQQILPSPAMFRRRSGLHGDAFWSAYASALEAEIARTRRHVSVVAYVLWAHEATDRLQNEPDHLDGRWMPEIHAQDRDRAELLKAAEILKQLDPSREVLFDEAGSLGKAVDVHPYFDFSVPLQEWEDWPERRRGTAVKPLLASEFSLPYIGAWTEWDPMSWAFQDGHAFIIENAARYLGDRAYLASHSGMLAADWRERHQAFVVETAIDPALTTTVDGLTRYHPNEAAEDVAALFATRIYRAWRTAGVHLGPFGHDTMTGASMLFAPLEAARRPVYSSLKTPGPKPDVLTRSSKAYTDTATPLATSPMVGESGGDLMAPTKVYAATKAAFRPVLVYLGGGATEGVTGKDHAYFAGEPIEKSVVVVKDGPADARIAVGWAMKTAAGNITQQHDELTLTAPQGRSTEVPLHLTAPEVASRTEFRLTISPVVDGREEAGDELQLQVFPRPTAAPALPAGLRIGLYDTRGMTARVLDAMGVRYQRIERLPPAPDVDLLVIGALSLDENARMLLPRLRQGMNILAFEQRVGAMSDLAAFTGANLDTTEMAAQATRQVFAADPDHPLLAALEADDLADWRGASHLLPEAAPASGTTYLYLPGGETKFRGSNRGIVSSWVLPKPQRGNFRVVLSTGFDLRQTALVEYLVGRGKLLLMQLDVTQRYGSDPVATQLVRNALTYMASPAPPWAHVAYLGEATGKALLDDMAASYRDLGARLPDALDDVDVLIVGAGAAGPLSADRARVLDWVDKGGRLLLFYDAVGGLAPGWLGAGMTPTIGRLVKGQLPEHEALLRGLNQSDAYFREGVSCVRVAHLGYPAEPSPVPILHHGTGVVAILPATSTTRLPTASKPATDKLTRLVSTVLTNAGVALDAPFAFYPQTIDLAGEWRFKTDPKDQGLSSGWNRPAFADDAWRTIHVPGLWGFQGVTEPPSTSGFAYDGVAWYRRSIAIPAAWKGGDRPLTLTIGGVAETGDVYWNGEQIAHGDPEGNYLKETVSIPVPEALVPYGGMATIAIHVIDKGPAGGLAGPIRLEKNTSWLTPRTVVRYGERYPNFEPDAYRSW